MRPKSIELTGAYRRDHRAARLDRDQPLGLEDSQSLSRSEARLMPKRSSISDSGSSASPGLRPLSTMSSTIIRATREATFSARRRRRPVL